MRELFILGWFSLVLGCGWRIWHFCYLRFVLGFQTKRDKFPGLGEGFCNFGLQIQILHTRLYGVYYQSERSWGRSRIWRRPNDSRVFRFFPCVLSLDVKQGSKQRKFVREGFWRAWGIFGGYSWKSFPYKNPRKKNQDIPSFLFVAGLCDIRKMKIGVSRRGNRKSQPESKHTQPYKSQ